MKWKKKFHRLAIHNLMGQFDYPIFSSYFVGSEFYESAKEWCTALHRAASKAQCGPEESDNCWTRQRPLSADQIYCSIFYVFIMFDCVFPPHRSARSVQSCCSPCRWCCLLFHLMGYEVNFFHGQQPSANIGENTPAELRLRSKVSSTFEIFHPPSLPILCPTIKVESKKKSLVKGPRRAARWSKYASLCERERDQLRAQTNYMDVPTQLNSLGGLALAWWERISS